MEVDLSNTNLNNILPTYGNGDNKSKSKGKGKSKRGKKKPDIVSPTVEDEIVMSLEDNNNDVSSNGRNILNEGVINASPHFVKGDINADGWWKEGNACDGLVKENPRSAVPDIDNPNLTRAQRRRLQHSQMEKQYRDEINRWIFIIRDLIPSCSVTSGQLHKAVILRKAYEFIQFIHEHADRRFEFHDWETYRANLETIRRQDAVMEERDRQIKILEEELKKVESYNKKFQRQKDQEKKGTVQPGMLFKQKDGVGVENADDYDSLTDDCNDQANEGSDTGFTSYNYSVISGSFMRNTDAGIHTFQLPTPITHGVTLPNTPSLSAQSTFSGRCDHIQLSNVSSSHTGESFSATSVSAESTQRSRPNAATHHPLSPLLATSSSASILPIQSPPSLPTSAIQSPCISLMTGSQRSAEQQEKKARSLEAHTRKRKTQKIHANANSCVSPKVATTHTSSTPANQHRQSQNQSTPSSSEILSHRPELSAAPGHTIRSESPRHFVEFCEHEYDQDRTLLSAFLNLSREDVSNTSMEYSSVNKFHQNHFQRTVSINAHFMQVESSPSVVSEIAQEMNS
ncbi:hypothetical protein BKA69DRAFT_1096509 [Paraphysoderma sedebokerense]|nr:hypothetical protein BKA69DRAFT_1096509 [Paraphysoderma sedebokerense]